MGPTFESTHVPVDIGAPFSLAMSLLCTIFPRSSPFFGTPTNDNFSILSDQVQSCWRPKVYGNCTGLVFVFPLCQFSFFYDNILIDFRPSSAIFQTYFLSSKNYLLCPLSFFLTGHQSCFSLYARRRGALRIPNDLHYHRLINCTNKRKGTRRRKNP